MESVTEIYPIEYLSQGFSPILISLVVENRVSMRNLYIETLILLLGPSEKSIKYYKFELITTKFIITWCIKGFSCIANYN